MSSKLATDYFLNTNGSFCIENYNSKKTFSSFLPGIAGLYGIPMWVFYVNRGQGVASFGIKSKDQAILEFFPANKAYQHVERLGFRTFVKMKSASGNAYYEPFQETASYAKNRPAQSLEISSEKFVIRDANKSHGLEFEVEYFTVPGEPLAALSRRLTVRNISDETKSLDMLDGLPCMIPYGMNEWLAKNMSRTIEAWMVVDNFENKAPFMRLRVDPADTSEVEEIHEGNFFFGFLQEKNSLTLLNPVADASRVFGLRQDLSEPDLFYTEASFNVVASRGILENRTPCAFTHADFSLAPGESKSIFSYYGHAKTLNALNDFVKRASSGNYYQGKKAENKSLVESIKCKAFTVSSSEVYDQYCQQTYLDNVLRGGLPINIGDHEKSLALYVYSRKHGDLERDYNRFLVEPTYFSQGNGNYRDVNQNRRNDVWFDPWVGEANIRTFMNYIQLDGYNPLVVKSSVFHFRNDAKSVKLLKQWFKSAASLKAVTEFMKKPFNFGEYFFFLESKNLISKQKFLDFVRELAPFLSKEDQAEHGEGFWVDHWTYNLDLIESYLGVYPENKSKLLFNRNDYVFYDNDHHVQPRSVKYVLKADKQVRQYKSVSHNKEKTALIQSRHAQKNTVRTKNGKGEIYKTTLFTKLFFLAINKLSSLDAYGKGIEMEADKPGWYDSLNGLPGLLGSSTCESFELKRLLVFLISAIEQTPQNNMKIVLPMEFWIFCREIEVALDEFLTSKTAGKDINFWQKSAQAKEKYRAEIVFGITGKEKEMNLPAALEVLEKALQRVEKGLQNARRSENDLYPTYFQHEVPGYSRSPKTIKKINQKSLPYFLEGVVHAMKVMDDRESQRKLWSSVRKSTLFDNKLSMYKVNEALNPASVEVGRSRIFSPGWLENESIWLHMEYKWILELIKSGLSEEFYEDFKAALVPFQPAERYGRSILENSSFIASSAFIDESFHGTGFVARLSGSTAEFMHMWLLMNVGLQPFFVDRSGNVALQFSPVLASFLFTEKAVRREFTDATGKETVFEAPKDSYSFLFLSKTWVTYHNPKRLNTYGDHAAHVKNMVLRLASGEKIQNQGNIISGQHALAVRDGLATHIDIFLE